jgi:L-threonylcarbamoyladenylate synthase
MSSWRLRYFSLLLQQGAVMAYPTDTIWGLGCHPGYAEAVDRIRRIKQRSANKGLILLSSNPRLFTPYVDPDMMAQLQDRQKLASDQPVTWIVKARPECPAWLSSQSTIAVRITDRSHIRLLCEELNSPLVSTSANLSGRTPARNQFQVHRWFTNQVDFVLDGIRTASMQASQIVDFQSGKILRP